MSRAPLIKSITLLRDLKGADARRKVKLMALVLNKLCNVADVPFRPRPEGLTGLPVLCVSIFHQVSTCFQICTGKYGSRAMQEQLPNTALITNKPVSQKHNRLIQRCPDKQQGFTLIELLVVVVIVSILFTYTTLAIRSNSPEDYIKEEAHRFERLTQLALEESILRGEEYAIEIFTDGYRFLRFTENQWLPVDNDRILRQRELPQDMELEVSIEETEIVIDLASNSMSEQKLNLDFSLDSEAGENDEEENEKLKIKPQIYLLSSGEITPEFEVRFYILGVETSYFVKGAFDGSLEAEVSDL